MEFSSPTVPFGDVVQHVAASIFTDLQQLLSLLHSISPETRTLKLITFLADSKKKLFQLLVIKKWLGSNNTTGYFKSLQQLDFIIQNMSLQLNIMQDNLYRLHGELYGKRVRSINMDLGIDVLSYGTYPTFPLSVLTCGQLPLPNDPVLESFLMNHQSSGQNLLTGDNKHTSHIHNQQKIRKDLTLFIQTKLLLYDPLPTNIAAYIITNGYLIIKQSNLYEVALSLQELNSQSPWLVLGVRILCCNHIYEFKNAVSVRNYDVAVCEEEVYRCLDLLSGDDDSWKKMMSLDARLVTSNATSQTDILPNSTTTHTTTVGATTINQISSDSITNPSNSQNINTNMSIEELPTKHNQILSLCKIHRLCTHAADGVILRILYTQFQDMKRSKLWMNRIEIDFQDVGPLAYIAFRFSKSILTGQYRYELQVLSIHQPIVIQSNSNSDTNSNSNSPNTATATATKPVLPSVSQTQENKKINKTHLQVRLMILDDLGNLNLPTVNPTTADIETLKQMELDKWLTQYQDRSSTSTVTHRVRDSILTSEIDLDASTVTHGVSSRLLLGDTLRVLARARVKTLAARIYISPNWIELSKVGLSISMDLQACTLTLTLSPSSEAMSSTVSLILHVDTRDCQWQYYGNCIDIFETHHCGGLAELFLNEANNIMSEQLTAGSLVSEHVQAEVDRALAYSTSSSVSSSHNHVETAATNVKPYVYLRPAATMETLLSGMFFIQSTRQIPSSVGLHCVTLSRNQSLELLRGSHDSRVVTDDLNLTPALVFELDHWTVYKKEGKESLARYKSVLPTSTPYFDVSAINIVSDTDSATMTNLTMTQPSSTSISSSSGVIDNSTELKPFLRRFMNMDSHDDNILVKKKKRKVTDATGYMTTPVTSQSINNTTTAESRDAAISDTGIEKQYSEDRNMRLLLMIRAQSDTNTYAVCAFIVSQTASTGTGNSSLTIHRTERISKSLMLSDEVEMCTQMPVFIATAIRWKNMQSSPVYLHPSFLFPSSPIATYAQLIHSGACIVLQPAVTLVDKPTEMMEFIGYVDSNRCLQILAIQWNNGLLDAIQALESGSSYMQIFKLLIFFSTSSVNGLSPVSVIDSNKSSCRQPISINISVPTTTTTATTATTQTRNHDILCLLFQRYFSAQIIYSTTQLHEIFIQYSFRHICALSILLSFQQMHTKRLTDTSMTNNTEIGSEQARLDLVHINIQSPEHPIIIVALKTTVSSDSIHSDINEWKLLGFIEVTAVSSSRSQNNDTRPEVFNTTSATTRLLFQDVGKKGFEDKIDSNALVSEKMYESLLQRLLSLFKMFVENQY